REMIAQAFIRDFRVEQIAKPAAGEIRRGREQDGARIDSTFPVRRNASPISLGLTVSGAGDAVGSVDFVFDQEKRSAAEADRNVYGAAICG
ncbi:hypothetical protein Q8G40_28710, partial [Klebsiella pneumoniae]|uniref:hypothetical protein n=1 Tax=Klebsiella pneumoniae TaxID=573 RepID=UPI003013A2D0